MAVDEAILETAGGGLVPPTLRLYAWDPPCLSLGYGQPLGDADLDALYTHGWEVVRRATGGRAILHTDELTYSVTGPANEPRLAGSVLESYQRLSRALLRTLEILSLPAEAQENPLVAPSSDPQGPVCFEVPSNYEITVDGKKLVGSAQARRKIGVLQHGTLPLYGDLTRITQALVFSSAETRERAAARLLQHATTVETVLGRIVSWEAAAEAMAQAFEQTLNLELVPAELALAELERAEELVETRYSNPEWKKTR
ncbi:MAG: lipoate--protein ligase family protein [Anaerolineales bacterium]|nr:lipoate--protein ligase family protein [Anaerolineales bacterium]